MKLKKLLIAVLLCPFALVLSAPIFGYLSFGAEPSGCSSLEEDALRSIILVHRDFEQYLTNEATKANESQRKLSPSTMKLLSPDNYALDVCDDGTHYVIKFDPKRLRQQEPFFGGSVKYMVNKQDFTFQRILIK